MPPKSPAAYRAGLPTRSKDGCLTCKAKHLKCDETRPACLRCSQKGLQCGGYWQGIRWSFKHQPNLQATPASLRKSPTGIKKDVRKEKTRRSPDVEAQVQARAVKSLADRSPTTSSSAPSAPSAPPTTPPTQLVRSAALPLPPPPTALVDGSSAFVINWFENVCPVWSGYDSRTNPIRMMAADLWSSSITVCSALESMSAAFMASRNPGMRQPALRLMKRATDYVQMELQLVEAQPRPQAVPTSLLFALFGLGTTICWVDPRGLGLPFFHEARRLLGLLNHQQRQQPLAHADAERLAFFNKCMTYCNMLLAFVHDEGEEGEETATEGLVPTTTATTMTTMTTAIPPLVSTSPHPWTGVSSQTSQLFAATVRLCRVFRQHARAHFEPYFALPLEDMQAERLEEQLLDLDIASDVVSTVAPDTGDDATPAAHLTLVAEAYRLASLLLLYQTFPNLVFLRLPGRVLPDDDTTVLWQEWITPLSLHLVKVLHRIPPSSGSRVIQPLLYISASTGLRNGTTDSPAASPMQMNPISSSSPDPPASYSPSSNNHHATTNTHLSSYISGFMGNSEPVTTHPVENDTMFDVPAARYFVMQRLSVLESSLPPTPVKVARDLVAAIWRSYDSVPDVVPVHWIDVMEANDLRSMFG